MTTPTPQPNALASVPPEGAPCLICGKSVPDYVATYCCGGQDCGCLGLPLEPCACSRECEEAIYKHDGTMEDRRIKAGIAKWTAEPPAQASFDVLCKAKDEEIARLKKELDQWRAFDEFGGITKLRADLSTAVAFAKESDNGKWQRMKVSENESDGLRSELEKVRKTAVELVTTAEKKARELEEERDTALSDTKNLTLLNQMFHSDRSELVSLQGIIPRMKILIRRLTERRCDAHGFYYVNQHSGGLGSELSSEIESLLALPPAPSQEQAGGAKGALDDLAMVCEGCNWHGWRSELKVSKCPQCRSVKVYLDQTAQSPAQAAGRGGKQSMNDTDTIHESLEAADEAMPDCPRSHEGADGGHWWYIDSEEEEHKALMLSGEDSHYVACICKTCGQKMRLDAAADEYPAV